VKARARSDGDVNPGSVELNKGESGKQSSDGSGPAAKSGREDAHEYVGKGHLDDEDGQTAKVGKDTAVGSEQAEDGSDRRGDSLRATASDLDRVSAGVLVARLIVSGGAKGLVCGRVLILDDSEGRVQGSESIESLRTVKYTLVNDMEAEETRKINVRRPRRERGE
jgi:hypothetical protein